jgi:hypothetical protein
MPVNFQCKSCGYRCVTAVKHAGSIIKCPECNDDIHLKCRVCKIYVFKDIIIEKNVESIIDCPYCHSKVPIKCPACHSDLLVPPASDILTPEFIPTAERKQLTSSELEIPVNIENMPDIQIIRPDPLRNEPEESGKYSSEESMCSSDRVEDDIPSIIRYFTYETNEIKKAWEEERQIYIPKLWFVVLVAAILFILAIIFSSNRNNQRDNQNSITDEVMGKVIITKVGSLSIFRLELHRQYSVCDRLAKGSE